MADYRELGEEDADEFHQLLGQAFRPQDGPPEPPDEEDRSEVGERRGMYDGEDLLAVCRQIYWSSWVRGEPVEVAGISAVASPPENRRKGVVGDMLRASLVEYRERDVPFAALWPFKRSFYARFGWATSNAIARVECPIETLSFADRGARVGEFRHVEADEWDLVDAVYREHAGGTTLTLERPELWWRERRFKGWQTDPFVYLYEREGDPAGYLIYWVDDDGDDGREMILNEFGWIDDEAFRECLRLVYYHDSQVEAARLSGPPDGGLRDLLDLVPDPDDVEYTLRPGPMVRVVDVADALSAIPYPESVDADLVIAVGDDHAEWNDGQFALTVADGEGACRPVEGDDPDVGCSINALAQLAVGYRSAEDLARVADLSGDDASLATLSALFPPTDAYLGTYF